ncbi:hypothetical protein FE257_004780 [Aspergillus nanangensis]|uniref:Terpene synthase n=1 Tax=Aspergillus nanangensis TaxID=2582783 RepID=A0AAD4CRG3_ASPNN|nr:hypothetical protein FE257_004780 [Aspergillus nanangensis]
MTIPAVEFGTTYQLPKIPISLPLECHPDLERREPDFNAWARPYLRNHFGESVDHCPQTDGVLTEREILWGAMVYPHCLPERFFALEIAMIWLTVMDDVFTARTVQTDKTSRVALAQRLSSVFDGSVPPESSLERMFVAGMDLTHQHPSVDVQSRIVRRFQELLEMLGTESDETITTFNNMDSYLEYRRVNLFGIILLTLTEWAVGIDVGDIIDGDHNLQTARDLVINHMILVNDIFSFPKEQQHGETMNSVWFLVGQQDLSLQESLDKIAQLAIETEARFLAIRDQILAGPLGQHPDVPKYLREIGHAIPGNSRYHRQSSRYFGATRELPDADPGPTVSEPIILYRREFDYKPNDMPNLNISAPK